MKVKKIIFTILIVAIIIFSLTACGAVPNIEKAEVNLKEKDYRITIVKGDDLNAIVDGEIIKDGEITAALYARKMNATENEVVYIYYFESKSVAKEAYDKMLDNGEYIPSEYEHYRSGSVVYWGTENAIKDMR